MVKNDNKITDIGDRLRTARKLAGLSQAQVAKMLSLHRPSISEMEAGRRRVSADELAKLAGIYDVNLSWLAGAERDEGVESDKVRLAARELAKLKPEDYKRMLHLLRLMRCDEESDNETQK
ncbi:MAG: helix-turn-helix domain-containing protein [Planctomycetota bacterium]|jgi:transcriptional regulator with XRE-family HTH domain